MDNNINSINIEDIINKDTLMEFKFIFKNGNEFIMSLSVAVQMGDIEIHKSSKVFPEDRMYLVGMLYSNSAITLSDREYNYLLSIIEDKYNQNIYDLTLGHFGYR